jgi:hypothetical protein
VLLDGQLTAQATTVDRLDVSAYGTGDHQITGGRFADVIRPGRATTRSTRSAATTRSPPTITGARTATRS